MIRISPTFVVLAGTTCSSASPAPIGSRKIQLAALQAVGEQGRGSQDWRWGEIRQIRGKIVIRERPYQGNSIAIPLWRSSTRASRLNRAFGLIHDYCKRRGWPLLNIYSKYHCCQPTIRNACFCSIGQGTTNHAPMIFRLLPAQIEIWGNPPCVSM